MKDFLAVIPARGGSKGVPRKNLRHVYGKPLIAWAVDALVGAGIRTCVSTDCQNIARRAKHHGAEVVWRPEGISGDVAVSEHAVLHAIDTIGWFGPYTMMVQCTTPLVTSADLMLVADRMKNGEFDCVFTVTPFHGFLWDGDANPIGHDPSFRQRRQDAPQRFLENGAAYCMRTEGFRETGNRFFGHLGTVVMPPERSMEVDEAYQLYLLDTLVKKNLHLNTEKIRDLHHS